MGSGSSSSQPTTQTVTQTNLPAYAQPYFTNLMDRSQAESYRPYEAYQGQRIAAPSQTQTGVQQQIAGLQAPSQFNQATSLASQAGLGSLNFGNYAAGQFNPGSVSSTNVNPATMSAAQTQFNPALQAFQMNPVNAQFNPNLQTFQMDPSQNVSAGQATTGSFTNPGTASQYMSPYMQNVVDVQKQQAVEDAQKAQLAQNLGAVRQGTYGGARQLLATTEREKALQQQLGAIQATGSQSAYDSAMKAYDSDQGRNLQAQQSNIQAALQAALANQQAGLTTGQQNLQAALGVQELGTQTGLQTALANQQAGLTAGQQNLQAALGVQELGTQTGLQTALANLSSEQQANVQNQATQMQAQGMNQEQALRAALANQQAGLSAQQMGEQSRQFGSNLGLQGLSQALTGAQTLGDIGSAQQQTDLQRLQAMYGIGADQRNYEQQLLDTQYADFLRQRDYPMEQLGYYSNILRGLPVGLNSTATAYAQPPSTAAQIGGLGLAGLSMYNMMK